jgi:hypothetical protein
VKNLLAPSGVLSRLPAHNVAVLTGDQFFPHLISAPFHHGLVIVFSAAAIMSIAGALVSLLRGKQFYYNDEQPATAPGGPSVTVPSTATAADSVAPPSGPGSVASPAPAAGPAPPADAADNDAPRRDGVPARRDHARRGGGA